MLDQSMQVPRDYGRSTNGEAAAAGVYIFEVRHASENASRIPLLRGQHSGFKLPALSRFPSGTTFLSQPSFSFLQIYEGNTV